MSGQADQAAGMADVALQTVEAVATTAGPVLAVTNPQAAAVASAIEIGATSLQELLKQVKAGSTAPADASAQAAAIAQAIQATHQAWDAYNQVKANPTPPAQAA